MVAAYEPATGCDKVFLCAYSGAAPRSVEGCCYRFKNYWTNAELAEYLRQGKRSIADEGMVVGGAPRHVIDAFGTKVPHP